MKEKKQLRRVVLIDAHALIHRAYHALPGFASSKGEPTGALYGLSTMVMRAIDELKPHAIFACFDLPKPTFRHVAYDAYKGTRQKSDDELISQLIRAKDVFDAFTIERFELEGFEADDLIGTLVEKLKREKDVEIIIVSGDMDTMQLIEGEKIKVYTLKKGIQETQMYDEKKVMERYSFTPKQIPDYKGLAGDPSDNIPGIKGIGEKTATELLGHFGTIEKMYVALKKNRQSFLDKGIKERVVKLLEEGEEEALFSKTLATIRLDAPIQTPDISVCWSDDFVPEKLTAIFENLEFRSLKPRVLTLGKDKPQAEVGHDKKSSSLKGGKIAVPRVAKKAATYEDTHEFKQAQAMVFLLDSDKTDPSLEEILSYTKTENLTDATVFLEKELSREKTLSELYEKVDKPLIPLVEEMEKVGIKIDVPYFESLSVKYHTELTRLEKEIWALAGREFLITSPKQLGEVLYDELHLGEKIKKTAGGARSTNADMLESLKEHHAIIGKILEYREIQKLVSTYVDPLPKFIDNEDRIHTHFLNTGAATGRFASRDPALQNIPIKTDYGMAIRKGFIADKGYTLLSCDYSQIELRCAAILSGDEHLLETFKKGEDSHASVASRVFSVPIGEVSKDQRRVAKVLNFGILYGMGVNALKENLGSDRKTAQEFYDAYKATFPTLMAYLEDVKVQAKKNGYTKTLFGRRRQLKMLQSHIPFIRAAGERMAINAPIQGTSADIMRIALIDLNHAITAQKLENYVIPLLQVHDEFIFEVADGYLEKAKEVIVPTMEQVLEKHKKEAAVIPILVSSESGETWADL
ncbi:MAG: DNA polymerase [Minisyncoccia bacterium]